MAADRVHFVGGIAPQRVGEFHACLDVSVFPSQAVTLAVALSPIYRTQHHLLPLLTSWLRIHHFDCRLPYFYGRAH
jgi:hypothetical protein